ncbi:Rhomboid protease GluP [Flavobacterium sp. ACN2]|jgi:membrane associated rhomboid family serine protease|nr:Rhomboid protease GluP [Flavobacterium sp. ACN2]
MIIFTNHNSQYLLLMNIILIAIIIANVVISYKGFNDLYFFRKYEFHVGSIRSGEQIRMLSSGFLHVDMMHLIFNMLTLYFFAPVVLNWLGNFSFILVYFGSLIFGSLLTMLFHKNDYSYRAVGASGAVTGVLYSAILLQPDMMLGIFFVIPMPAYIFGIVYLLYSIYGMKAKNDNIGHTAHFGGAIGGYLITLIKMPSLLTDHTLMVILLAIPILILFGMAKLGKL